MTRSAPARASARPKYWPSPRLVPVTMATLPLRSNAFSLIFILVLVPLHASRLTHYASCITFHASRQENDLEQPRFLPIQPVEPGRSLGQRRGGADQRSRPQCAARQHVQAGGILPLRGAGAVDGQLARHRGLKRE